MARFCTKKRRRDAPKMAFQKNEIGENREKKWTKHESEKIERNHVCIESKRGIPRGVLGVFEPNLDTGKRREDVPKNDLQKSIKLAKVEKKTSTF